MFSSVHPSTSEPKSAHTGRGETDPVMSVAWRGNYGNGLDLFHLPQLQVPSGSTPAVPAPFPPAKSSPARRLRHPHGTRHLLTLRRFGHPPARLLPSRGVSGPGPGDRPPPSPPPPHPRRPPALALLASAAQRPAAASLRAGIRTTRAPPPRRAPPRSKDAGPRWLRRPLALHAPDTQDADTRPASRARAPQPARTRPRPATPHDSQPRDYFAARLLAPRYFLPRTRRRAARTAWRQWRAPEELCRGGGWGRSAGPLRPRRGLDASLGSLARSRPPVPVRPAPRHGGAFAGPTSGASHRVG